VYAAKYAVERADEPLFVLADHGEIVTFREYEAAANRAAHLFQAQGLQIRDHVAFLFENNLRMLELEGGAERTGLYYTCINSYLSADEVAYLVNDSKARIVATSISQLEVARQLPGMCPNVERWLVDGLAAADGAFEPLHDALAAHPAAPVDDERLGAAMLYSSGTTGQPKGILRPLPDAKPSDPLPVMEFAKFLLGLREGMTFLNPAPLYHSAPQASVSAAVRLGATTVVMERFDAERWLALVEQQGVTHSAMVPTMFSRLLKLPEEVRSRYDVSSLECIVHAAAPCPVPVKQQMIDWFGPIVLEYYGATEANGYTHCTSDEWLAHPGTVGRCVYGELLILDDDGNECPTGTPGTVWFRGATNFAYYNAPEKTQSTWLDGDRSTSTVGDVGDDGFLYLTDRKTYMIISGGVNIYPQETENLLITHPKVMDAAVFGIPNDDLGEEVKAVVQPVEGVAAGPELAAELIGFCRDHLAHFKCPRSIDFSDALPRLPTGKLYKRILRDAYWSGHQTSIV